MPKYKIKEIESIRFIDVATGEIMIEIKNPSIYSLEDLEDNGARIQINKTTQTTKTRRK
jgi:hypothetical protein